MDLVYHQESKLDISSTEMGWGDFWSFMCVGRGWLSELEGQWKGVLILWDNWWLLLDRIQVFLKVYNLVLGAEIGEF